MNVSIKSEETKAKANTRIHVETREESKSIATRTTEEEEKNSLIKNECEVKVVPKNNDPAVLLYEQLDEIMINYWKAEKEEKKLLESVDRLVANYNEAQRADPRL
eukprot:Awhi_evm1s1140